MNWRNLQNGSDIRGVALEGVADEPVTLTPKIVRTLGWAFADWLKEVCGISQPRISIGHDSRCSASRLKQGVAEGIELSGGSVGDCGLLLLRPCSCRQYLPLMRLTVRSC